MWMLDGEGALGPRCSRQAQTSDSDLAEGTTGGTAMFLNLRRATRPRWAWLGGRSSTVYCKIWLYIYVEGPGPTKCTVVSDMVYEGIKMCMVERQEKT